MKRIFWWWFRWAMGFNFAVLGAAMGLGHAVNGSFPLRGAVFGLVCAAITIALAAVAIAKIGTAHNKK